MQTNETTAAGPERECRRCHCTESRACPGGCFWVLPDICSACAISLLVSNGLPATPLVYAQQVCRDIDPSELLATVTEHPIEIPAGMLCCLLNAVGGWVKFLTMHPIRVADGQADEMMRALASDTALALDAYDRLAGGGLVPSRAEISAIYAAAGVPAAPAQLEVPGGK